MAIMAIAAFNVYNVPFPRILCSIVCQSV